MTVVFYRGWLFDDADFSKAVKAASKSVGPDLAKLPMARSRVRTGRMAQSWLSEAVGDGVRVASEGVAYTFWNEYSSRKMSAQPMLQPSIPEMRILFSNAIKSEINKLAT